jgi:hypothetical protein
MDERRTMRRFSLRLPCLICVLDNCVEEAVYQMETDNISTGGAYLRTAVPMPPETRLNLELLVRRGGEAQQSCPESCVCLSGQVMRSDPTGMAVRFDGSYQIVGIAKLIQFSRARSQWMEALAQCFGKTAWPESRATRVTPLLSSRPAERHARGPVSPGVIRLLPVT